MAFAAGAAVTASALSEQVAVSGSVLWTVSAAAAVLAVTCFVAHWDVNRGRRVRQWEIEEEGEDLLYGTEV